MKMNGKILEPIIEVMVIPRQTGDLVFKAKPVNDYDIFDKLCPVPKPPMVLRKGESIQTPDLDDDEYKEAVKQYNDRRVNWMMLESLKATDGLEWSTVNYNDPTTWDNYKKELVESGLTAADAIRIFNLVIDACGLNQKKIDEATKAFLASQAEQQAKQ